MINESVFHYLLIFSMVFMPLERLLPYHDGQAIIRKQWLSDISYVFINGLLLAGAFGLVIFGLMGAANLFIPEFISAAVISQPIWLQVVELIILGDIAFYWTHRAFHHYPFLWRFHAVHHSIEDLDWLAGHRVHMMDQLLTKGASLVPAICLGFSIEAIAIWGMIYAWHSVSLHSNVKISLGPLNGIIASPHFHHWHHAAEVEAHDKNFAGQLSILDRIFGTIYLPERAPSAYGIKDKLPTNWAGHFFYPFRRAAENVAEQSAA